MRADRLLSALLLLQAHGRLTGRELAERLEVSARTVHRDMEALSASGVPVLALRGACGGWQLDKDWRTQVPALDESELRAFLMAQPRILGNAGLAGAAERALGKLMAALPASLRDQAASIQQRLHIDTTGWDGVTENLSLLPLIQDAVSRDRKLAMTYLRDGEPAERVVDPLGLVAKGSTWYLVAKTPRGLRTYRVSRIVEAALLDAASDRPPDFDLAAYWKSSIERLRESRPRYETTLRASPRAEREMRKWRTVSATADGGTITVRFESEEQATFVVLGFAAEVDVVAPESLRERVIAQAKSFLDRAQALRD